ncbi:hypothetical protein [Bacillus salipaludis]|uniref:Uncharacterized protein n=1 Tax=Bacillus salipaludis TaxID=2547811 RepID=A0AA90R6R3_9BACI|nr:hypothetical protein [Bacillus salipaludis]MDQ6596943.1 hypothetical protein [Bacillus salipaludis]
MAVLKDNGDILYGVDWSGRHVDFLKMLTHFLRAWADSRKQFSVLLGVRDRGDPQERSDEDAPRTACAWSGNQQPSLTEPIF